MALCSAVGKASESRSRGSGSEPMSGTWWWS